MGLGGWLRRATTPVERLLAVAGGLLLFYATAATDIMGVVLFGRGNRAPSGPHTLRCCHEVNASDRRRSPFSSHSSLRSFRRRSSRKD